MAMRELMIVSGLSGSGKSTFSRVMEEQGFRVVEEIPSAVIPAYIDYYASSEARECLVIPIEDVKDVMEKAKNSGKVAVDLILLNCKKRELLTRFAVTRHTHPFEKEGISLDAAIDKEIAVFKEARPLANQVIDTSGLASSDLRRIIFLLVGRESGKLRVLISSFAYKNGLPDDADIVFDTRIVPNPFWDPKLGERDGRDPEVVAWLDSKPASTLVLKNISNYLDFYLEEAGQDHRTVMSIYIGSTGGMHRSVYFANKLYERYKDKFDCLVVHRALRLAEQHK